MGGRRSVPRPFINNLLNYTTTQLICGEVAKGIDVVDVIIYDSSLLCVKTNK